MGSPLDPPEGDWWNRPINRRETIWLGISGAWAMTLFGWMVGWSQVGGQNQIGPTTRVSPDKYQERVSAYKEQTNRRQKGYVPPGKDVFIAGVRYGWDGLPVVLQAGREYKIHIGSYDVQHGLSIRKADTLSKQLSLQVLPGYEWVVPMTFDEPGEYHVVCNEFCGEGHRSMHGVIHVEGR